MEVATLLLHVVDITHHDAAEQALTVEETIDELGLGGKTRVTVLNKVDLAVEGSGKREADRAQEFVPPAWAADGIPASAEKGWGLAEVRAAIERALTESAERERAAAGRG
jgi:GTP-binding protein HflX